MNSNWEVRERKAKRAALIITLLIHAGILLIAFGGLGSTSLGALIHNIFQEEPVQEQDVKEVKV